MKLYINYGYRILNLALRLAINVVCLKFSNHHEFSEQFFISNLLSTIIIFGLVDLILFKDFGVKILNAIVPRFFIVIIFYCCYFLVKYDYSVDNILLTCVLVLYFVALRVYDYKMLIMKQVDFVYLFVQIFALFALIFFHGFIENLVSFLTVIFYVVLMNYRSLKVNNFLSVGIRKTEFPYGLFIINQWLAAYIITLMFVNFGLNGLAVDYYLHSKILESFAAIVGVASSLKYVKFNANKLSSIENYLSFSGIFLYGVVVLFIDTRNNIDWFMVITLIISFISKILQQKKIDKRLISGIIPNVGFQILVIFFSVSLMYYSGLNYGVNGLFFSMICIAFINYFALDYILYEKN